MSRAVTMPSNGETKGRHRYVDTGPDKEKKEFSLPLSFFWERSILVRIIRSQSFFAQILL
jgi:hypothetical protein